MRRTLLTGLLLAVAGALTVWIGSLLNLGLENAVYGIAVGAVLGLVHDRGVGGRLGVFLIGVAAAWASYAVRAQFLPDSVGGAIVALLIILVVVTLVAAFTGNRLPLWAGLLGAAAYMGAYEAAYNDAPYNFLTDSPIALSALLVPVAVGFLVGVLSSAFGEDDEDVVVSSHREPSAGIGIVSQQAEKASS